MTVMTGSVTVERLNREQQVVFDDLKQAAKIMDAPFNAASLAKTLNVFAQFYTPYSETSAVAYRVSTNKKDVSMRYIDFTVPHNPFEMALAGGLTARDGHPVEDVLDQLEPQVKLLGYGCDLVVTEGFEKVWPFFHMLPIEALAKLGAMPDSVRQSMDYFAKHKMEQVSLLAVDYYHRTVNVYFMMRGPDGFKPGGMYTREQWAEMFTDLGFDRPSEAELDICMQAFTVYPTFSWDSPEIKRLCVCMPGTKLSEFPYQMHPVTERFVKEAPVQATSSVFTYCPTYGDDLNYLKMEVDYSGQYMPRVIGPLLSTLK